MAEVLSLSGEATDACISRLVNGPSLSTRAPEGLSWGLIGASGLILPPERLKDRLPAAMKYQELLILLPCHSLEDFPTYHEGDDAQSLLASWSALWHPELLASAGKALTWRRIEDPPSDVKERLIVVPSVCVQRLPTGFAQRVKDEGGVLIRKTSSREEIVAAALAPLRNARTSEPKRSLAAASRSRLGRRLPRPRLLLPADRAAHAADAVFEQPGRDLFQGHRRRRGGRRGRRQCRAGPREALGLLQRAGRRARSLLSGRCVRPRPEPDRGDDARRAAAGRAGAADRRRTCCSRPILLAEMAAKASGDARSAARRTGGQAHRPDRRRSDRDALAALVARVDPGRAAAWPGEVPRAARPPAAGLGRWRYGLTPHLPGILHKLGFKAALHAGFEEGKTPDGLQFKVRWEGLDGSAIDAIARTPLDATKPQTFLGFATKMGESMDADHVATLCLAHWPGQASPWMDDLRRIAGYCSALGKLVTVDEYFAKTDQPGQLDRFEADRYRSPYLKQAIIRKHDDPISTQVRYWQRQAAAAAAEAMETLATLVAGKGTGDRGQGTGSKPRPVVAILARAHRPMSIARSTPPKHISPPR